MDSDLLLRGKYTFRVGGQKLVLVKKSVESLRHVEMKALLWALYLSTYHQLQVEVLIGYKYKPDLVQSGPVPAREHGERSPLPRRPREGRRRWFR